MKVKKQSEPKTYTIRVECSNCEHEGELSLPKGVEASGQHDCPHCGCKTATKLRKRLPFVPLPRPERIPVTFPQPYPVPVPVNPYTEPWKKPMPWRRDIWYQETSRTVPIGGLTVGETIPGGGLTVGDGLCGILTCGN